MAIASHLFLAFGLILVLAITGAEISAEASVAEWDLPLEQITFNFSGDSVGSFVTASGQPSEDVVAPFSLLGDSVTKPMEVPREGKSALETEDGLDIKISYEPGFGVINAVDGLSVQVQCFNDYIPNPPMIVDYIIPVGEQGDWNLNVIDPSHPHERYLCNFVETSAYIEKRISYEVWSLYWDRNLQPAYCVHCFYKVANDGLYVEVQTHNNRAPHYWAKLTNWLLSE